MSERLVRTAERIRRELADLEQVASRIERALRASQVSPADQDLYLDALALNLHDFYTGLERIFRHIAAAVDGQVPESDEWHRQLLHQMSLEVPQVRPQVLSVEAAQSLDEYLRFRHVVRNIYAFDFDPDRIEPLVTRLPATFAQVRTELLAFADFLVQLAGPE